MANVRQAGLEANTQPSHLGTVGRYIPKSPIQPSNPALGFSRGELAHHDSSNPTISCQCGAVNFRACLPEPLEVYVCHCLECRKQSASAFGVSALFPSQEMRPLLDSVRPQLGVWKRPTDAGNTLECYFCKTCGVRILHRSILPNGEPKPYVTVKGGCLDSIRLDRARHIWTRSALVPVPENSDPAEPA